MYKPIKSSHEPYYFPCCCPVHNLTRFHWPDLLLRKNDKIFDTIIKFQFPFALHRNNGMYTYKAQRLQKYFCKICHDLKWLMTTADQTTCINTKLEAAKWASCRYQIFWMQVINLLFDMFETTFIFFHFVSIFWFWVLWWWLHSNNQMHFFFYWKFHGFISLFCGSVTFGINRVESATPLEVTAIWPGKSLGEPSEKEIDIL